MTRGVLCSVVATSTATSPRSHARAWLQRQKNAVPTQTPKFVVQRKYARSCAAAAAAEAGMTSVSSAAARRRSGMEEDGGGRRSGSVVSGAAIRERFLRFFTERGHQHLPSSSLVPEDPTVLLTIAGMLQFKPVFLGQVPRQVARATTSQKCMRTNDIENVGVTKRHHTFFEMLGNFSFGDYFKEQAVKWAWELSTQAFKLPEERIWVSVFRDDDETYKLWNEVVGVPAERIKRLDEKDNFWAAGPTGPCGPCSELYYDFHPERGTDGADLEDDSRFIEFYNIVFMESNRDADGVMTPLEKRNIDTGMGLERMAQILQQKPNNYETDLIFPIVEKAAALAGLDYFDASEDMKTLMKVIGDHSRAVTYMISDGVTVSNVGRGYVLRRLIRRAVRSGRRLGVYAKLEPNTAFLPGLAETAVAMAHGCDPEVQRNASRIYETLEREELLFLATLDRGEKLLQEMLDTAKASFTRNEKEDRHEANDAEKPTLSGENAFMLYDTFGFPFEITQEVAAEAGVDVDIAGFERAMENQRLMSQASAKTYDITQRGLGVDALVNDVGPTNFIGYEADDARDAKILALACNGELVESAAPGTEVDVLLDTTPFYGESGGQVGDVGSIEIGGVSVTVDDCQKAAGGRFLVHRVSVGETNVGLLQVGASVHARVNTDFRQRARCNHTATHLLQSALREILGDGVAQAGSLVDFDRLRFDFSHPRAVSSDELEHVERLINTWIFESHGLETCYMGIDDARAAGALAMFGEKYGDIVRVVDVPGVSMELCGGLHVGNTSEVGCFRILSESGIAAGVRRIEAVSGPAAVEYLQKQDTVLRQVATNLKLGNSADVVDRVSGLQEELRVANKAIASLRAEVAVFKAQELIQTAESVGDSYRVIVARLDDLDAAGLKAAAEGLASSLGTSGAVLVASGNGGKATLIASFGEDVVKGGCAAGTIVASAAKACGGGGGGKPGFAQAGGKKIEAIDDALASARHQIVSTLQQT